MSPVIRPMFYDFPENKKCWDIEDQYMFGPDILVVPILYEIQCTRTLYLPAGRWKNLNDGKEYIGGVKITI